MTQGWFIRKLLADQYKQETAKQYASYLALFTTIIPKDIRDVTGEDILHFLHTLRSYPHRSRNRNGTGYSDRTIQMMCGAMKRYFRYLLLDNLILCSPFDGLAIHIFQSRKMRDALPVATISQFLDSISGTDRQSLRDRAIFEMLYGTGMRVGELCNLTVKDVDINGRRAYISQSKNGHDRYVPLGNELLRHLSKYVKSRHEKREYFFCNNHGGKLTRFLVSFYLSKRLEAANMQEVKLTPHIFRHSFATHMLHGGAHIRHVQEILGHESLESTVVYTHFDVPGKRKLMKLYHPLENELSDILEEGEKKH